MCSDLVFNFNNYRNFGLQIQLFHDGGRYHIETSPLICRANQLTDFYMITASVEKELSQNKFYRKYFSIIVIISPIHFIALLLAGNYMFKVNNRNTRTGC